MNYGQFFREATGHDPYPYQVRVANELRESAILDVPTGLGKTEAVIVAWLWRRRFASLDIRAGMPRRLVYCLPTRVLVSQTADRIRGILENLGIRDLQCAVLMGGDIDQGWDEKPEEDAILVGTQDQLISRALNRGYGLSRYRWPIDFAWLNADVLWVLDEVQLMGPSVQTAAQLQGFRDALGTYGPSFTVWMSATQRPEALRTADFQKRLPDWELWDDDRLQPQVSTRIGARKRLERAAAVISSKPSYYKELAREVVELHRPGTLTLVVLNQVERAQKTYQEIMNSNPEAEVVLLHARFRPAERVAVEAKILECLPKAGRIIVSTQVIEAGLDLSAHRLFTEIAPWPSMVQRFGRCNRDGQDREALVKWIDVSTEKAVEAPYREDALEQSREILDSMDDVGIDKLPRVAPPEPIAQVIRRVDLLSLFDTTADLSDMDIDVSRFIRDRQSLDVAVLWRDLSGGLEHQPSPAGWELCPVSLRGLKSYVQADNGRKLRVYRYVDGQWSEIPVGAVYPGQTLLLDASLGGYDVALGFVAEMNRPVPPLPLDGTERPESDGTDPHSYIGRYVTLEQHLADVRDEAQHLLAQFSWGWPAEAIVEAAAKHDWGKALDPFQAVLLGDQPTEALRSQLWAKSPYPGRHHLERPHLRHELASALAVLETGGSDLVAYLAAAHHGKVRMSIRSQRDEKSPGDGRRFARGVWDGDVLPEVPFADGVLPSVSLNLDVVEIGGGASGESWASRADRLLREEFGPFRLAVLEAVVRIADWRGTRKEMEARP